MHATEIESENIKEGFKKTRRIRSFEILVGNWGSGLWTGLPKEGKYKRDEISSPASSKRVLHCTILSCVNILFHAFMPFHMSFCMSRIFPNSYLIYK